MAIIANSAAPRPELASTFVPPTAETKAAMRAWAHAEAKRRHAESFEGRMEALGRAA